MRRTQRRSEEQRPQRCWWRCSLAPSRQVGLKCPATLTTAGDFLLGCTVCISGMPRKRFDCSVPMCCAVPCAGCTPTCTLVYGLGVQETSESDPLQVPACRASDPQPALLQAALLSAALAWGLGAWGAPEGNPLHASAASYLRWRAAGVPAYALLLACQVCASRQAVCEKNARQGGHVADSVHRHLRAADATPLHPARGI